LLNLEMERRCDHEPGAARTSSGRPSPRCSHQATRIVARAPLQVTFDTTCVELGRYVPRAVLLSEVIVTTAGSALPHDVPGCPSL